MTDPPDRLSERTIATDRWDRQELVAAAKENPAYRRARSKLGKMVPTGADALNDAFWAILKADPQVLGVDEVRASHLVNRMVMLHLSQLAAMRRVRSLAVGDPLAATTAAVDLEPTLEGIFDRLALHQRMARDLEALMRQVWELTQEVAQDEAAFDEAAAAWTEHESPETDEALGAAAGQLGESRAALEELQAQAGALFSEITERLDGSAGSVRIMLRDRLNEIADRLGEDQALHLAWGTDPGELHRMPAAERVALAKRLNTPRLRAIAEVYGRVHNLALSDVTSEVEDHYEEIVDLELGDDLSRVAPSEFLYLGDDVTERDFFARYAGRELLQYSVRGEDNLGRGGIVMCVDGSMSMAGQREVWAKAIMLVLLHLAREQKRQMHVIHFGGPGAVLTLSFVQPSDFTPARIVEAAEVFWASGTDFQTPMRVALDVLGAEFSTAGCTKADVVFLTDGECSVPAPFMQHYLDELHRMSARTWGLHVSQYPPAPGSPLTTMCEGRVMTVQDLTSGRDVRQLMRGVQ